MNKYQFKKVISKNIMFKNKNEKKEFFRYYDELISEMTLTGKLEEQALASLNIHNIIQEYNESNHINYEYNAKVLEYKTNLNVFNHSIFIGFIIPLIILLIDISFHFDQFISLDFLNFNNSKGLYIVIVAKISYSIYFLINIIYFSIQVILESRKKKVKVLLFNFLMLFCYYALCSGLLTLLMYSYISVNIFAIVLLTLLLFTPYIYFIIKKRKLKKESTD